MKDAVGISLVAWIIWATGVLIWQQYQLRKVRGRADRMEREIGARRHRVPPKYRS